MRKTEERSLEKARENLNAEEKGENYKRNKSSIHGITLIALVVTIIILLILAGITVGAITGENGIIGEASNAKMQTEISQEKEIIDTASTIAMGKNKYGEITKENLDKELDKNPGSGKYSSEIINGGILVTFTESERKYIIDEEGEVKDVVSREGLKVGDYINYTPDTNSTGYSKDKLNSTYTGSSSNSSDLTQDTLNWQILRIYEDGRMDLIGSPTSQNVYFQGATGYNNGVTVMNDICKELYSKNTKGITARSVKLEDMESWLTESGKTARGSYSSYTDGPTYGHTQTYVTNRYYPNLYAQAIGGKIDSGATEGIDVEEGNKTGLTESEEGTANEFAKASTNITVTQSYYNIPIDSTNYGDGAKALSSGESYWVASRYAKCDSSCAYFGLRYAYSYMYGYDMYYSRNISGYFYGRLRPVVSLGSEVQVETCSGTNSTTNMHTITQY